MNGSATAMAPCKNVSLTNLFVQKRHWEWRLSIFFLKKNLKLLLGPGASGCCL
jgi:hypothetical protein